MKGPLPLTAPGAGYPRITHAACMASLGLDILGMDTGLGKVDQLKPRLKVPAEPALQLRIDIDFHTSADANVAPIARQDASYVRGANVNALAISFPFHTKSVRTRMGSIPTKPSILQLHFGQPLMPPEGTKLPRASVAAPGPSAMAKCFTALG